MTIAHEPGTDSHGLTQVVSIPFTYKLFSRLDIGSAVPPPPGARGPYTTGIGSASSGEPAAAAGYQNMGKDEL